MRHKLIITVDQAIGTKSIRLSLKQFHQEFINSLSKFLTNLAFILKKNERYCAVRSFKCVSKTDKETELKNKHWPTCAGAASTCFYGFKTCIWYLGFEAEPWFVILFSSKSLQYMISSRIKYRIYHIWFIPKTHVNNNNCISVIPCAKWRMVESNPSKSSLLWTIIQS